MNVVAEISSSSQLLFASSCSHGTRLCQTQAMAPHNIVRSCCTSFCKALALRNDNLHTENLSTTSIRLSIPLPALARVNRGSFRAMAIRREPISQAQRNAELEEEARRVDLAPHTLLEKGEPGTLQGIIKGIIPVGYFVTLPNGRDGYLPALDLGITGGIVILERLFKVGQELTIRIVRQGGSGREILSMKKREFAPNTDPRFIFSKQGGFGKSSSSTSARKF